MEQSKIEDLKRIYNGVSKNSVDYLHKALKGTISKQEIKDFLKEQETYQLQRPHKQKPYQTVIPTEKNEIWELDLTDMSTISRYNQGYKWIMVIIDSLTKYLRVIPMKNKNNKSVVDGVSKVLKDEKPVSIYCDPGSEFTSSKFKDLMKRHSIKVNYTRVGGMAPNAERSIQSIRSILYKSFQQLDSLNWIDLLDDVVKVYNTSYNRNIKMTPEQAEKDVKTAHTNLYLRAWELREHNPKETSYEVGDQVRVALKKKMFEKGVGSRYSKTLYTIKEKLGGGEFTQDKYKLSNGNIRYGYELQKVGKLEIDDRVGKVKTDGRVGAEHRIQVENKEKRKGQIVKRLNFKGAGDYWKNIESNKQSGNILRNNVYVEVPIKKK